jgi:hypothetical protein
MERKRCIAKTIYGTQCEFKTYWGNELCTHHLKQKQGIKRKSKIQPNWTNNKDADEKAD